MKLSPVCIDLVERNLARAFTDRFEMSFIMGPKINMFRLPKQASANVKSLSNKYL